MNKKLSRPAFNRIETTKKQALMESMAPVRQAAVGPMLVGRELEELRWEPIKMDDPRLTANPDWLKEFRDFAWSDLNSLTLRQFARIERTEKDFQICIYNRTDYDALLAELEKQGLSLPAANELLAALTPEQKGMLAEMLQDEHIAGIHTTLAYINKMMNLDGLELHQDGESYPNDHFESLHYDFISRCDGDEWPE